MSDTLDPSRLEVLAAITQAWQRLTEGKGEPHFVERYFRLVPADELHERDPETYAAAALSHRRLGESRVPGVAKVSVFNPTVPTHGWDNQRTVIQIVTDDMPFLVDSVTGAIVAEGIDIHLVVHPQLIVRRNAIGELEEVCDEGVRPEQRRGSSVGEVCESWMLLSIDRQADEERRAEIEAKVRQVLSDVRESVEDWPKMRTRCLVLAAELEGSPPRGVDAAEIDRAVRFLRWMADNHFTFLGYREYVLETRPDGDHLVAVTSSGLGLMRADAAADQGRTPLTGEVAAKAREPKVLIITKANSHSTVHRHTYLDYVGVKSFDDQGQVVGERRFLGLYASTAYTDSVQRIPVVSDKVREVLDRADVPDDSHTAKDLMGMLESHPRDELFQADVDELYEVAMSVTQLRRRTRLFLREDDYGRFVSCLVYIPRDRYNTAVRVKMADILLEAFGGQTIEFTARVSEHALSRLQFIVHVPRGEHVRRLTPDQLAALEERLVAVSRTWTDRLGDALRERHGVERADALMNRFGRGFPAAYEDSFSVNQGVADLSHLDRLTDERRTSVALYRPHSGSDDVRRFKLFRLDPLSLTHVLPIFTHMGVEVVDENPFEVTRTDGQVVSVYDFGLRAPAEVWDAVPHEQLRGLFEEAVLAVWDGEAESDGFNQLILASHLTWRQVVILRTIGKYLRQTQSTFSQHYYEDALISHPAIAGDLVELFEARFDPQRFDGLAGPEREAAEGVILARLTEALDGVSSLDHDRIIRSFMAVIRAGLRTNFYQVRDDADGVAPKGHVSLKLNPKAIPDLPAPRPVYEIWVYSPRVEGVHLRFGAVARGGLRWSDRREDFRTEILGLVKAQMVKNAVIVPTGSKGGFYAKQLPDPAVDREAWLEEGRGSYRVFISGLLDLTDDRTADGVVAPPNLVRHDGDDPYLVVAADKGTASFSDLANSVAAEYGFWLDDAFASGGSVGYDHKGMGITARGAWESVKRHFRELGHDTQTQDFTVVGVGDMSGDVFGNGMLLSEHIRLVCAFDHRHVFVDPAPDAASSYAERRRLFDLPRSSWDDYDKSLISEGGGVFARSLKSIAITPQMREALGLPAGVDAMTPTQLIHHALMAPVDLLWNGGIGTYVKATSEENSEVGDRANDATRVNGEQLRARVVGEGGNLGCTQLGRIEAAVHGVRINTDAIDNSAGVDTSDHEVNIKIMLGEVVGRGELTMDQRNELLASMTDDVALHVLRDNYEQNVLLGNARAQQHSMVTVHERLIRALEERGLLDRVIEFLPSDAELEKRQNEGTGLTSPEFAVLVAYTKIALKDDLLASELPDDPYFTDTLAAYFPPALREKYSADFAAHPLKREIITNAVANGLVNRGGITFVQRTSEETGATPVQVTRAFVVCREVFGLTDFVEAVEALDNVVPTAVQTQLYLEFRRLLDRAARWFIAARPGGIDIAAEIARFGPLVAEMAAGVPDLLRGEERKRLDQRAKGWIAAGVPEPLARRAAALLDEYSLLDIVDLATDTGKDPHEVAALYYLTSERFGIDSLLSRVSALPREDHWDALARGALRNDLYQVNQSFTRQVIQAASDGDGPGLADPAAAFDHWVRGHKEAVQRAKTALAGIRRLERPGVAALSVALRTLRSVLR